MTGLARHTDPETSHEAAAGVNLIRSQMVLLTYIRAHAPEFFTDHDLVRGYRQHGTAPMADSRIRTARLELASAGLVHYAGKTLPGHGRRMRVWSLDADAAMARRIETQEAAA